MLILDLRPLTTVWGTVAELGIVVVLVWAAVAAGRAGHAMSRRLDVLDGRVDDRLDQVETFRDQLNVLRSSHESNVTDRQQRPARLVGIYETPSNERRDPKDRQVYLRNASDEAIYDVTVVVVKHRNSIPHQTFDSFQPRSHPYQLHSCSRIMRDMLEEMAANEECTPDHVWRNTKFGLSVAFRDASDRHWQRLPDGTLTALGTPADRTVESIKTAAYDNWNQVATRTDA